MPHRYTVFILQLFCKTVFTFPLVTTVEEIKKEAISPNSRFMEWMEIKRLR